MRQWIALAALISCASAQAGVIDVNRTVDEVNDGALILDFRNNSDLAAGNLHNSLQVDPTLEDGTLRDALFDHVSKPDDVLPGDEPTDDDVTAIN